MYATAVGVHIVIGQLDYIDFVAIQCFARAFG
jgi:hypothetical protein